MRNRHVFIHSVALSVAFSPAAFSEHAGSKSTRAKVPARVSECSQSKFEGVYGLNKIEEAARSKSALRPHPLLPAVPIMEKRSGGGGGGGSGAVWSYEVTSGWRYRSPDDSVFRLAVSDSLSCLLDQLSSPADYLSSLLKQDSLFNQHQPNPGHLKKDATSRPEDLLVFQKMRSLFEDLKETVEAHKENKEIQNFFRAFFQQIKLTNESLLSSAPKLEIHPELLRQLEKLRKGDLPELKSFLESFTKTKEFDYWLHPTLANYFRIAIADPSFSLAREEALTEAQAQDLGRQFQQVLQGSRVPSEVKEVSFIDPVNTQGTVRFTQDASGNVAQVFAPKAESFLAPHLQKMQARLAPLDKRRRTALLYETAQKLSRAYHDLTQKPGQSLSPQHLALQDSLNKTLDLLSESEENLLPGFSSANAPGGVSAQNHNKTDREVLDPLRTKLESELTGHKYPLSLQAIRTVSDYPDSIKELIQTITKRIEPKSLSQEAKQGLEDFLITGETQHLFDLLFKDRSAFDGAVVFFRGAKEASPSDQALNRASSLLTQMNSVGFTPSQKWSSDYAYTRRLLKDSIDRLSQDPSREKDRDTHILALRLLDEMGLVGVTDRDTKSKNSYLPETLYQELASEQRALMDACNESQNRSDCIQKLERSLLDRAHQFLGTSTGLTSEIRKRVLESFSPSNPNLKNIEAHLRRLDNLPPGSPLRQSFLFSDHTGLEALNEAQTNQMSRQEASRRVFARAETGEPASDVAKKIPELFKNKEEARAMGSDLAFELSTLFSRAATETEKEPLRNLYQCLASSLLENAGERNNPLAIRTLAVWLIDKETPAEVQEKRLSLAAKDFNCLLPEEITEGSVPIGLVSQSDRTRIGELSKKLDTLHQKEMALSPSKLSERALIELEKLRRLEIDIQREKNLFGQDENPVMESLKEKKSAAIKELKNLGLPEVLKDPIIREGLAADKKRSFLSKAELSALEENYKLLYDPTTNSFLITPETKLDQSLFQVLNRAHGINLRYQSPGQTEERFLSNGGHARALLALLASEASGHGISPLSTQMTWEEIRKLDSTNPDGKPLPKWFPVTESTSARLIETDGVLSVDFKLNKDLSLETRKKMEKLIQARTDAHSAAANYGSLGHSMKSYFGHMVGSDPTKTSETEKLKEAYSRYASLRTAFADLGIAPIGGSSMTTDRFNRNELLMMREYLKQEDEAIHSFLTNVETLHSLTELALTAPLGAVGKIVTVEASLAKLAAGTGKSALAARSVLRTLRLAGQLANPIGQATRHGLSTSALFQGVEVGTEYVLSNLPDSAHAIAEDRIKRAKEGGLGSNWRKYPENPAVDPKWGSLDQNGQPTDTTLRKPFLRAVLEYNMEESMDIDGDGVIDELQGKDGSPVPFARKRGFSLKDPHRLQHFAESAAFFRNLSLAKSLPVPRWITLPTEMSLAGTLQELVRSEDSVRWAAKQHGELPKSLSERLLQSAKDNFIEGGRFGLSGMASNAALSRIVGGKSSTFNTLLGALLFSGVDTATKAALNKSLHGYTGYERGSWEEFGKDLIKENAVSFYIGMGIAGSGISRQNFQDLKSTYLKSGESALRKATGDNKGLFETVRHSVESKDLTKASPEVLKDHLAFLEERTSEGNRHFLEAVRYASESGKAVLSEQEAYRLTEINQTLLTLYKKGAWNHREEISNLLVEQDQIFERLHKGLPDPQQLEAKIAEGAADGSLSYVDQIALHRDIYRLQAQERMLGGLTEAAYRMSSLRVFAEPVKTMAALANPRSELAKQTFIQRPNALNALLKYQQTLGEQAWRGLAEFGESLVEANILPDQRRGDTGEGGPRELVFGPRPSIAGFTGREQRAAAQLIERVFKSKSSSAEAKQELLEILYGLDPVRADILAQTLPEPGKTK